MNIRIIPTRLAGLLLIIFFFHPNYDALERPSQSSHQYHSTRGRTSGHGQKLMEEKDQLQEWESRPSVMRTNDSSTSRLVSEDSHPHRRAKLLVLSAQRSRGKQKEDSASNEGKAPGVADNSLGGPLGAGGTSAGGGTVGSSGTGNRNGPYFDLNASKNVTALLGKTAYLNCRIKNLGNKTMVLQVSWVRHRDIHLLTVGRYTYTTDQRFRAIHNPHSEDWTLQIKYPQHRDSGIYECQISTTPHMSHFVHLNVIEPTTEIIGGPELFIDRGSTINLTCVVLFSPEPPAYIFWNHNDAIISYESPRGGVSVITEKGETTTSFLLIQNARPSDSGQYQCNPSNAQSKTISVHVLNGEYPAAMQRGGQALLLSSQANSVLLVASLLLLIS